MTSRFASRSMLALALLLGAATARAQTVDEILARHAKAVDPQGRAASIPGVRMTANLELPAMGISGSMLAVQRRPNQSALTIGLPGIGEMRQGFDGTSGWASDPMGGPRLMAGAEAAAAADGADFRAMTRPAELFSTSELAGEGSVNGEACVRVKHTWKSGRVTTDCYSTTTWLILETVARQSSPQGEVEAVTRFSDFRTVDGITTAHRMTIDVMGMQQVVTTTSIEFKEQPAEAVEPPVEIKALKKP